MKKSILSVLVLLLVVSCVHNTQKIDILDVNGYWQIDKVVSDNGEIKEYPTNVIYDYYQIKDSIGFYAKTVWQPNNVLLTNNIEEKIVLHKVKNNQVSINYSSKFGKYTNLIQNLTTESMVLIDGNKTKYYYKKVDLNTTNNGKKIK
jgi:hypothetical protein